MNFRWGAFRIDCPKPKRAKTKESPDELCTLMSAALVSPAALASPKRLCSWLKRLYLAGHENDKLGLLCKVLLQNSRENSTKEIDKSSTNLNSCVDVNPCYLKRVVICCLVVSYRHTRFVLFKLRN